MTACCLKSSNCAWIAQAKTLWPRFTFNYISTWNSINILCSVFLDTINNLTTTLKIVTTSLQWTKGLFPLSHVGYTVFTEVSLVYQMELKSGKVEMTYTSVGHRSLWAYQTICTSIMKYHRRVSMHNAIWIVEETHYHAGFNLLPCREWPWLKERMLLSSFIIGCRNLFQHG